MVLHLCYADWPREQMSVTTVVMGPPALVLFEFEVAEQPLRHICFTKRPKELYGALTKAIVKKWKGEKIEFAGGGYKGSIEKHFLRGVLLVFEISPPYFLRCELMLNPQEVNVIRNKMGILLE